MRIFIRRHEMGFSATVGHTPRRLARLAAVLILSCALLLVSCGERDGLSSLEDRGDLNCNGIAYEIADAVMFTNYFIEGLSAFGVNYEGAIAASDANADGLPLTVADLVYLIRVVVGGALPYPKTTVNASYSFHYGVLNVDSEMGAAVMTFEGTDTPTLLASQMDMRYAVVDGNTRVIVFPSINAPASFMGDFVKVDGQLINAEFATFDGQMVRAKYVDKRVMLYQNYPNPFNATTQIAFAQLGGGWEITIRNMYGSLVHRRTGNHDAGSVSFEWNASDQPSGIYYCTLKNKNYTLQIKMVRL